MNFLRIKDFYFIVVSVFNLITIFWKDYLGKLFTFLFVNRNGCPGCIWLPPFTQWKTISCTRSYFKQGLAPLLCPSVTIFHKLVWLNPFSYYVILNLIFCLVTLCRHIWVLNAIAVICWYPLCFFTGVMKIFYSVIRIQLCCEHFYNIFTLNIYVLLFFIFGGS